MVHLNFDDAVLALFWPYIALTDRIDRIEQWRRTCNPMRPVPIQVLCMAAYVEYNIQPDLVVIPSSIHPVEYMAKNIFLITFN